MSKVTGLKIMAGDLRISKGARVRTELVSISNVTCAYSYATPECSFDIEGRFPDGALRRRQMFEQLGWTADGRLQAVIVMYHRRR